MRRVRALRGHLAPSAAARDSTEMMLWKEGLAGGPQTGNPFFRPVNRPPSPDEPQRRPTPPWSAMQEIGVRHCTFPSASFDCEVGYCIYLPPGYSDDGPALPVIYNLHGAGGNEFHSFDDVVNLHEGIVAGNYPPAIVVLPNGGFTWYKNSWDGRFPAETMFLEELIPHIDDTYSTIAAHHGRCIEGYSMGGRGATRLAIKYPQLFCSLHNQAGNVLNLAMMGGQHDGDGRGLAPGWDAAHWEEYLMGFLGPDKSRYIDDDTFLNLEKNLDQIKGKVRIQIGCGTLDDTHLPTCRLFHEALLQHGVDHTYVEYEDMRHDGPPAMIRLNKLQWFDYHFESMRRAAANLPEISILPVGE